MDLFSSKISLEPMQIIGLYVSIYFCKFMKLIGVCSYRFLALGAVLSYLIIIVMRWIAGPMVLICILLFIGFFVFGK